MIVVNLLNQTDKESFTRALTDWAKKLGTIYE
jgi:hypothetical protein